MGTDHLQVEYHVKYVYPKTAAGWKPGDNLGKSVRSSVFHKYRKQ